MTIDAKLRSLLLGLTRATASGKFSWDKKGESDAYEVRLPHGRISIERGTDSEENAYFDVVVKDPVDRIIETIMIDTGDDLELANELYLHARRKALNLDFVLDQIIGDVNAIAVP